MGKLTAFALCTGLLAAVAVIGAGAMHAQTAKQVAAAHSQDASTPVAIVALSACKDFAGAVVVTADGEVHTVPANALEAVQAAAKLLPKGSVVVARMPCDDTPKQET